VEEEKWGEELLLPGEGEGMVGGSRRRSSSSTPTMPTITNHQLVGRVEEIEPQVMGCEGRGGREGGRGEAVVGGDGAS